MEAEKTAAVSTKTATPRNSPGSKLTWTEEIEVAGEELVASVKRLAVEGKVSRIRLIDPDGDVVLEMPLTIGAVAGGAVVLAAPLLAVIGALAVFATKVKLEVVRVGNPPPDKTKPQ